MSVFLRTIGNRAERVYGCIERVGSELIVLHRGRVQTYTPITPLQHGDSLMIGSGVDPV